ncbi:MAG: peptidylprolyl isomerase [Porticoccaceae bacterium]
MTELVIGAGTRVTLHFSLALEDGQVVDSNFEGGAAVFEVGDGNLPGGFEELLMGMSAGQEQVFDVPPEKAFGQHNPSNVQVLARADFSPELDLQPGLVVSFADANRAELPGVISAIESDSVTVDFNHPLAGHTLSFRVAIIAVEPVVTH